MGGGLEDEKHPLLVNQEVIVNTNTHDNNPEKRGVMGYPKYYIPRRYVMVLLCFLATIVCYWLRTNMSMAIIPMTDVCYKLFFLKCSFIHFLSIVVYFHLFILYLSCLYLCMFYVIIIHSHFFCPFGFIVFSHPYSPSFAINSAKKILLIYFQSIYTYSISHFCYSVLYY